MLMHAHFDTHTPTHSLHVLTLVLHTVTPTLNIHTFMHAYIQHVRPPHPTHAHSPTPTPNIHVHVYTPSPHTQRTHTHSLTPTPNTHTHTPPLPPPTHVHTQPHTPPCTPLVLTPWTQTPMQHSRPPTISKMWSIVFSPSEVAVMEEQPPP